MTVAILFTSISFAQELRYEQTGYIDAYGVRQQPQKVMSDLVRTYVFSGDFVSFKLNNTLTIRYKFHHRDGQNSVYYLHTVDMVNGREYLIDNDIMVVSPNRDLINMILYQQGKRSWTIIYERRNAESHSTMQR